MRARAGRWFSAVVVTVLAASGLVAFDGALPAGAAIDAVDLGTLGGTKSRAIALNDAGLVVGESDLTGDAAVHAFAWDESTGMTDLGTLGGTTSTPVALNDSGMVAGVSALAGDATSHAFTWDAAHGMTDLGTLGGSSSSAVALNDAGQVVGWSKLTGDATSHVFLWDASNGMTDLGAGPTSGQILDLDEAGRVLVAAYPKAWLWSSGEGWRDLVTWGWPSETLPVALTADGGVISRNGTVGGTQLWDGSGALMRTVPDLVPEGESAGELVLGQTTWTDPRHAAVWDATNGIRDLHPFSGGTSTGVAVNDAGQVAGHGSDATKTGGMQAFVWDEGTGARFLAAPSGMPAVTGTNALGLFVAGLNSVGDVVGTGSASCGTSCTWQHAVLWHAGAPPAPEGTSDADLQPGQQLSTDGGEGDGATAADPVESGVTLGAGVSGPVSISETAGNVSSVSGYRLLGTNVHVTAPVASATAPTTLRFELDAVLLPLGFDLATFELFRNGVAVAECTARPPDPIVPDPCIDSAALEPDGDLAVTALTSGASVWEFGVPALPLVSVGAASTVEGDSGGSRTPSFAVTLSRPATSTVTVTYSVSASGPGAPTLGSELQPRTGKVVFKPSATTGLSATSKTIAANVYPDLDADGDETYTVTLETAAGAVIRRASAIGTIVDDDPVGAAPQVAIGDATIIEGDAPSKVGGANLAKVWITLSESATVPYSVLLTAGGSAVAGTDYKAMKPKLVKIGIGQRQKAVAINVLPNTAATGDRTVTLTLSAPSSGLTLGRSVGTLTIADDD